MPQMNAATTYDAQFSGPQCAANALFPAESPKPKTAVNGIPALCVSREYSAERVNSVVNHPDVRPWMGSIELGPLDLSGAVADPRNVLLMGQGGGLLFMQLEAGLYEVHTQFLPEHRGKEAVAVVRDALRWMFTRSDAVEIVTRVPKGNDGALGLVRAIRGQLQFERPKVWPTPAGMVDVAYYSKTIMSWARDDERLSLTGEWFHGKLEAAKAATAGAAPLHDDDDAHDRYVGAAAEMIAAGQVAKGINFYNRWAKFAGYGLISVIALNPVVIDIGDAILAVRGDDFDVLLCR